MFAWLRGPGPPRGPLARAALALLLATASWPSAAPAEPAPVESGVCESFETYVLAVHGGAVRGRFKHARKVAFLAEVLAEGRGLLEAGATSLDVVHAAIRALEDSGLFNAGRGAIANQAGKIELDASIMDGRTRNAGAVAAVGKVKNPISAARLVMEKSPHVLMVGPGAEALVRAAGGDLVPESHFLKSGLVFSDVPLPSDIEVVPPGPDVPPELAMFSGSWAGLWGGAMTTVLVVERLSASGAQVIYARGPYEDWGFDDGVWLRQAVSFADGMLQLHFDNPRSTIAYRMGPGETLEAIYRSATGARGWGTLRRWDPESELESRGTVGAVALDRCGDLAAGTSTGGFGSKTPGRVGDSPIIGAGTYARNETAAVSATGHGEYFIRLVAAYEISALMEHGGLSLEDADSRVVHGKLTPLGGRGGVIAVDRRGNIATPFNTDGMVRGIVGNGRDPQVEVY